MRRVTDEIRSHSRLQLDKPTYDQVFGDSEFKEGLINSVNEACARSAAAQMGNQRAKKNDDPSADTKRRRVYAIDRQQYLRANPDIETKPQEMFPEEDVQAMIVLWLKYVVTNKTRVYAKMVENSPANLKKYTRKQFKNKVQHLRKIKDPRMFPKALRVRFSNPVSRKTRR